MLLCLMLSASCASSFKSIAPSEFNYTNPVASNCLKYDYKYDVLALQGNDKYARKEASSGIRIIGIQLTNLTDSTIYFSKDINIYYGQSEVVPMHPEAVKARIHQVVPVYLLYNLGFAVYTERKDGFVTKSIPIPFGTVISIINMLVAGNANANFYNEIKQYCLINRFIKPNETLYGILCINSYGSERLRLELNKGECTEAFSFNPQPVATSETLLQEIYYQVSDSTYENYRKRMEEYLKLDDGIIEYHYVEKKYKNGNVKYRGFEARHKYGVNTNYRYDIGTWEYFFEDGRLQKREYKNWREIPEKIEEF